MSAPHPHRESLELVVTPQQAGMRLDVLLARQFPQFSRVHIRKMIVAGGATVDGRRTKVAYRLQAGERVHVTLPELPRDGPEPEDIPLEILYEDDHLAAINKPPAMVVHPSKGHWSGTLTAALAFHFDRLSQCGGPARPGVVHRLDRDTSGVIVVAKTDAAHLALARQFEQRSTKKGYAAIVLRAPELDRDVIDRPIGAHPSQREKMAIREGHATTRVAQTYYEVAERFRGFALLRLLPRTGRTHQIRVHLASIASPVLCDRLYGGRARLTRGDLSGDEQDATVLLSRQALHAHRLQIRHPATDEILQFEAPLPEDMQQTLRELRQHRRED